MSNTPNKVVINCETGVIEEIPLTNEEISANEATSAQLEADRARFEAETQAIQIAKESAITKLSALGLTPEEIAALSK